MKDYFFDIKEGILTCLLGLSVTIKYFFRKATTVQYPDERLEIADRWRGKHHLYIDKCIGCLACARACPGECIFINLEKLEKKKIKLTRFTIDYNRCLFCGFCIEPCPTNALFMSKEYEMSYYSRKELYLDLLKTDEYSPEYFAKKSAEGEEGEKQEQAQTAEDKRVTDGQKKEPVQKDEKKIVLNNLQSAPEVKRSGESTDKKNTCEDLQNTHQIVEDKIKGVSDQKIEKQEKN